jgi:biopolymer transport protein ExbB
MGPVGETLLMTALGLIVALPAVLIYNLVNRSNAKRLLEVQAVLQQLSAVSSPTSAPIPTAVSSANTNLNKQG